MSDTILNAIAVRVLEAWLLSLGLQPSGGWDENDPNCCCDHGPHRVWTVCARIPTELTADMSIETLFASLRNYIDNHNQIASCIKFQPYDTQMYECPCGCGTFLYASIYQ